MGGGGGVDTFPTLTCVFFLAVLICSATRGHCNRRFDFRRTSSVFDRAKNQVVMRRESLSGGIKCCTSKKIRIPHTVNQVCSGGQGVALNPLVGREACSVNLPPRAIKLRQPWRQKQPSERVVQLSPKSDAAACLIVILCPPQYSWKPLNQDSNYTVYSLLWFMLSFVKIKLFLCLALTPRVSRLDVCQTGECCELIICSSTMSKRVIPSLPSWPMCSRRV